MTPALDLAEVDVVDGGEGASSSPAGRGRVRTAMASNV